MDITDQIRKRIEAEFTALFYGGEIVTNAASQPQESVTAESLIAHLQQLRLAMPKLVMFLSSRQYPDRATSLKIESSEGSYVVAHPDFWTRFRCEMSRERAPERTDLLGIPRPMFGIEIVELDGPFPNTEFGAARRRYVEGIWRKVIDAIKVACVPLPDWLKTEPKFGRHQ